MSANKKLPFEQVTSNHLSYIAIILMDLSKCTDITSLLYLVLLKEKTERKKERKKNNASLDAELKKKLLKTYE